LIVSFGANQGKIKGSTKSQSGRELPHSKTQARYERCNHGNVLECGGNPPLLSPGHLILIHST
jgi:hypothetical protein